MPVRILITGGAGFIGTELLKLCRPDDDVLVVDNFHPQVHGLQPTPPASRKLRRTIVGDVTSPETMAEAAEFRPDVVVHLAAETGTGQSLYESRRHSHVNVTGTATLLDALSSSGHLPRRIVLTSSRAVYGEGKWSGADAHEFYGLPRTAAQLEDHRWNPVGLSGESGEPLPHVAASVEPRPSNVYAATKLAQENLITSWATSLGVSSAIVRLQNVYGAGQAVGNPYTGVLTAFAQMVVRGSSIPVYEGGGIVRDFVHVSDVTAAIDAAIRLPERAPSFVADIGSGSAATLLDVARLLASLGNSNEPTVTDLYRLGDVRAAFADITAASDVLGYAPLVSLRDGLGGLLDFVASEVGRF